MDVKLTEKENAKYWKSILCISLAEREGDDTESPRSVTY